MPSGMGIESWHWRNGRGRVLLAFAFLLAAHAAGCERRPSRDWQSWRGDGTGSSAGGHYPTTWSKDAANVRWRTELPGVGGSSPIVAGQRIWLTAAWQAVEAAAIEIKNPGDTEYQQLIDPHWRGVLIFDRATGKLLHRVGIFFAEVERVEWSSTIATPSPVADQRSAWVFFGSHLARVDQDGAVLWRQGIDPTYLEQSRYGAASSPVLTRERVIVVADKEWGQSEDPGWIAAFDRETGERHWRIEWQHTCCSYSTPLILDRGAGEEIVLAHSGEITSYAAADGRKLWSHAYEISQLVPSPIYDGRRLFVAGGGNAVRGVTALELSERGPATKVETVWFDNEGAPQTSSPLLFEGRLLTVTDIGIVTARDPEDGKVLWRGRLNQSRNRASLVAGDGKIYASSMGGKVEVLRSGPDFLSLAQNGLGDKGTYATPALVDGCVLLRTASFLTCVEAERETI